MLPEPLEPNRPILQYYKYSAVCSSWQRCAQGPLLKQLNIL